MGELFEGHWRFDSFKRVNDCTKINYLVYLAMKIYIFVREIAGCWISCLVIKLTLRLTILYLNNDFSGYTVEWWMTNDCSSTSPFSCNWSWTSLGALRTTWVNKSHRSRVIFTERFPWAACIQFIYVYFVGEQKRDMPVIVTTRFIRYLVFSSISSPQRLPYIFL